jgi:hypothetical protein
MVTLWVNRAVALVLFALIFFLPAILDWYLGFRYLSPGEQTTITIAFYICVVIIGFALWTMDGLLRSILKGRVFVRQNVRAIRRVCWCCGLVAIVTAVTCFAYLPLIFLAVIMGFLCLTVSVVCGVMDAAVTIREENDLTI